MKISTGSWHYRLIRFNKVYPKSNICPYMRSLVWAIIMAMVKLLGVLVVAFLVIGGTIMPLLAICNKFIFEFLPDSWFSKDSISLVLLSIGSGMYFIAALLGALFVSKTGLDKYRDSRAGIEVEPTPPSVFATWWRDFHDKTCTRIEFDTDESFDNDEAW